MLYYCIVPILVALCTHERNYVSTQSISLKIVDKAALNRLRVLPYSKWQVLLTSAAKETGIIKKLELERCRWTSYGALEVPAVLHPRNYFNPPMSPGRYHLMRDQLVKRTFAIYVQKHLFSAVSS